MPRGMHPNSLANLKKGKRFGNSDDPVSNTARDNSHKAAAERKGIADEMRAIMDAPPCDGMSARQELARKLVANMDKSPEWYKLGLRMLGELPPEQVEVSRPAEEIAQDIREALEERMRERGRDAP